MLLKFVILAYLKITPKLRKSVVKNLSEFELVLCEERNLDNDLRMFERSIRAVDKSTC